MKEIQTPAGKILLVKVPRDAYEFAFSIFSVKKENPLIYRTGNIYVSIDLPQGNWQILNTASKLTEEQLDGLVENYGWGFYDYSYPKRTNGIAGVNNNPKSLPTRLESFRSLMTVNEIYIEHSDGKLPYEDYGSESEYEKTYGNCHENFIAESECQQAEETIGEWLILIEQK